MASRCVAASGTEAGPPGDARIVAQVPRGPSPGGRSSSSSGSTAGTRYDSLSHAPRSTCLQRCEQNGRQRVSALAPIAVLQVGQRRASASSPLRLMAWRLRCAGAGSCVGGATCGAPWKVRLYARTGVGRFAGARSIRLPHLRSSAAGACALSGCGKQAHRTARGRCIDRASNALPRARRVRLCSGGRPDPGPGDGRRCLAGPTGPRGRRHAGGIDVRFHAAHDLSLIHI